MPRLKRAIDKNLGTQAYYQVLAKCAKVLSLAQIKKLPEDLRDRVMKAYEKAEEKKKL